MFIIKRKLFLATISLMALSISVEASWKDLGVTPDFFERYAFNKANCLKNSSHLLGCYQSIKHLGRRALVAQQWITFSGLPKTYQAKDKIRGKGLFDIYYATPAEELKDLTFYEALPELNKHNDLEKVYIENMTLEEKEILWIQLNSLWNKWMKEKLVSDSATVSSEMINRYLFFTSKDGHSYINGNVYNKYVQGSEGRKMLSTKIIDLESDRRAGYLKVKSFDNLGMRLELFNTKLKFGHYDEEDDYVSDIDFLIIDLRDNHGGFVTTAEEFVSFFSDERLSIVTSYNFSDDKKNNNYITKAESEPWDIPIYILVNGFTASSSEIVAGAMQDHGMAWVIGTQTFGKGIISSPVEEILPNVHRYDITNYYQLPSGRLIQGYGVEPDFIPSFMKDKKVARIKDFYPRTRKGKQMDWQNPRNQEIQQLKGCTETSTEITSASVESPLIQYAHKVYQCSIGL